MAREGFGGTRVGEGGGALEIEAVAAVPAVAAVAEGGRLNGWRGGACGRRRSRDGAAVHPTRAGGGGDRRGWRRTDERGRIRWKLGVSARVAPTARSVFAPKPQLRF